MIFVRTACGAAVLEGRVWVVGGYVTSNSLNYMHMSDVEFLDLASNTWRRGPNLNVPRANCGVVALGGTLYVFGGENAEGAVHSVERLDGDEWTVLSDTRVPGSAAIPSVGACVVFE
jgi:N-acetylneuraminic acid mutarotase